MRNSRNGVRRDENLFASGALGMISRKRRVPEWRVRHPCRTRLLVGRLGELAGLTALYALSVTETRSNQIPRPRRFAPKVIRKQANVSC